jgi:hypothetical protein
MYNPKVADYIKTALKYLINKSLMACVLHRKGVYCSNI